MYDIFIEIEF